MVDLLRHEMISGKLEEGMVGGWLSDYLVAWHGPSGSLAPNVTAWCAAERTPAEVEHYLASVLAGIVPAAAISVENA